jgi:hypothetical protein
MATRADRAHPAAANRAPSTPRHEPLQDHRGQDINHSHPSISIDWGWGARSSRWGRCPAGREAYYTDAVTGGEPPVAREAGEGSRSDRRVGHRGHARPLRHVYRTGRHAAGERARQVRICRGSPRLVAGSESGRRVRRRSTRRGGESNAGRTSRISDRRRRAGAAAEAPSDSGSISISVATVARNSCDGTRPGLSVEGQGC